MEKIGGFSTGCELIFFSPQDSLVFHKVSPMFSTEKRQFSTGVNGAFKILDKRFKIIFIFICKPYSVKTLLNFSVDWREFEVSGEERLNYLQNLHNIHSASSASIQIAARVRHPLDEVTVASKEIKMLMIEP